MLKKLCPKKEAKVREPVQCLFPHDFFCLYLNLKFAFEFWPTAYLWRQRRKIFGILFTKVCYLSAGSHPLAPNTSILKS
jgi:hypothetical protein